ncbi:hypothetical protein [Embleya sp. NPDC001921]
MTAARGDLTIVQRRSPRSGKLMDALVAHGGYRRCARTVGGAWRSSEVRLSRGSEIVDAGDVDTWAARVRDPDTVVLTTALGEANLDGFVPALGGALAARARLRHVPPLVVAACENRVGPAFTALARRFAGSTVHFTRTVVDRMCLPPDVRRGRVWARTEWYGSWSTAGGSSARILAGLIGGDRDCVFRPVGDLHAFRRRKRWLVNTPQLALALHAHRDGVGHLDRFARGEGAGVLADVQEECRHALTAYTNVFRPDELREFGRHVTARLTSWPMPTELVLRRLRPENMRSLPGTVRELLMEPSQILSLREGRPPPTLVRTLRMLVEATDTNTCLGSHGPRGPVAVRRSTFG